MQDMEQHGVECLDCVSVDNALVRTADPLFAGFCHEQQAECGEHLSLTHLYIPVIATRSFPLCMLEIKFNVQNEAALRDGK